MSNENPERLTFTRTQRSALALTGVVVLCGFIISCLVSPDPRGYGTHQQFGFPPCPFQVVFQVPCPSCGGTTSMAHFVRGQWLQSIQANPAVFVLGLISAFYVPWSLFSSRAGYPLLFRDPFMTGLWTISLLGGFALTQWVVRLILS